MTPAESQQIRSRAAARPGAQRAAAFVMVAVALSLGLLSCSGPGIPTGSGLDSGGGGYLGIAPLKPGDQVGLLFTPLHNLAKVPVFVRSVDIPGQGVGSVIRVIGVRIASDPAQLGGGSYSEVPPESRDGKTCDWQPLDRVHGFRIDPHREVRVWEIVEAKQPGRYFVHRHVVVYAENGSTYQQSIPAGFKGTVTNDARYLPMPGYEARCLKATGSRALRRVR